jgi:hypothetical protein
VFGRKSVELVELPSVSRIQLRGCDLDVTEVTRFGHARPQPCFRINDGGKKS